MKKELIVAVVVVAVVVVAVVVLLLLRGGGEVSAPTTEEPVSEEVAVVPSIPEQPLVVVENQEIEGLMLPDGDAVVVGQADFVDPGYIVIHVSADGKPGAVIGNSRFYTSGSYSNVEVEVGQALQNGDNALFAMLHTDDGDSLFEFPGDDAPTKVDGAVVVKPFTVLRTITPAN
ncbi:hypothetical protein MYX07_01395 [Patescibacteria group bacterium AH-259-L07]|nr:hypothetical protein [Patescibacteria group bacterium AH-259-L07]